MKLMTIKNPTVAKIFDDLDSYRDWCRFEGKVYDEKALYNKKDSNWQAYGKYQNYLRAVARANNKR